jgi:hypothetical protein
MSGDERDWHPMPDPSPSRRVMDVNGYGGFLVLVAWLGATLAMLIYMALVWLIESAWKGYCYLRSQRD